jgi:uncharacterized protein (DUF362 family)
MASRRFGSEHGRVIVARDGRASLSRRAFLAALPVAALVACRRRPYQTSEFVVPSRSSVALLPADSYDKDLSRLIADGLRMFQVPVRNRRVFLKPNLVEYESTSVINTNPRVVAAAATAFLSAGAREVVVGEGPGHRRDIEYLLGVTGMTDELRGLKVRFVDLNHDDVRVIPLRSRYTELAELALPVELLQSDLIVSMPKLKTHHWAGMTASMKNLFGVVPGAVYGWPKNLLHFRGIDQSICDLNATVRPHLTIVDAVVGMEGDGPIMGQPRPLGFIAMGTDLLAVDATCARVIGINPEKLPYLAVGSHYLGNIAERRIDQIAEQPSRYHTEFALIESMSRIRL